MTEDTNQRIGQVGRDPLPESVIRLLAAPDSATLLDTAFDLDLSGLGARAGALYLTDDERWLRLVAQRGMDQDVLDRFAVIAPDAALPIAMSVRERRPFYGMSADYRDRYPDIAALQVPTDFVTMPLLVDDRCLGALIVELSRPGPLSEEDHQLLLMVTGVCAHRLEHLLALERSALLPADSPRPVPTERNEAQRTRKTRVELAMSSGDIGSFEWNIRTGAIFWDERQIRHFGLDPETFDSRFDTFMDAVHPDDRERLGRTIQEGLESGDYHCVYRVVWPDRSVHWLESKGTVHRGPGGQPETLIGVVWDRTEQRERESRREAHREFVLRMTHAFAAALSTRDVLDAVTGIVLPELGASALAVHIEHEGRLILEGAVGYPADTLERLRLVGRVDDNPMSAALLADGPLFLGSRRAYLERFPDPRLRPAEQHQAFIFLPLTSADGTVGSCLISYDEPREFTPDDQIVAATVSGILGQSLARARLSDLSRRRMTELQQLMMTRTLPPLPGFEVAGRYLPAAEGMQVGGDWFDVLTREDGGASLVIGDVQGHSAEAAGVMGQLRTALRAHAADGYRAEHLMRRGNSTLWGLDTDRFATCCITDVSPRAGHLQLVRAGHPTPLQAEPDGAVHELAVPTALPLGVAPDDTYPVYHGQLVPGASLLLYTDGLVDHPDRPYDDAVAALADLFRTWATPGPEDTPAKSLETLADAIVSSDLTQSGSDDVAILILRRI
ncbi:SpoIIE family protein phosphatase [Streptomyces sp. NPDC091292]|uniref:SpoIIE family protein phosphatase n=1 Tax=Streptomyces sp. NPDC091292 TaxID=3365991 RepID=UPI003826007C